MVIVGLLVIALICLIVGLVLPNAAWLIASLIATGGAGYLLFRSRTVAPTSAAEVAVADHVDVATDTATETHTGTGTDSDVDESHTAVIPVVRAQPDVKAEPEAGLKPPAELEAEPGPEPAPEPEPEPAQSVSERDVWVIDGRPRYHLQSCAIIKGQEAEPIPWEQASEDGFMPCSLCEPDAVRA